ncbi:hypothetical protein LSH36_280g01024, partial [Paralvinella palmiformis]
INISCSITGDPESGVDGYLAINRYVLWVDSPGVCHGGYVRSVCIFGVGDLQPMADDYHMFANKFYYDFEPMALRCLVERHRNWTRDDILGTSTNRINNSFYGSLPNVKNHITSGLESN